MAATRHFSGRILSVVETTEGTTPTDPDYIKFSDHVSEVSLGMGANFEEYRDIGSYDVASFLEGLSEYHLKVTYLLHTDRADQLNAAIDRLANNDLESHSIEVSVDRDGATPGFFTFAGAKAESVDVTLQVGKAVEVTISYLALSGARASAEPSVGTGSRETAALSTVAHFKTSTITRGGSDVAFITRGAKLNVAHELTPEGDDNSAEPAFISVGNRKVSGTVDMSIDDGGSALADTAMDGTAADIVFDMGTTGAPSLTASNAHWKDFEITLGTRGGILTRDVPFDAESVTTGTVA